MVVFVAAPPVIVVPNVEPLLSVFFLFKFTLTLVVIEPEVVEVAALLGVAGVEAAKVSEVLVLVTIVVVVTFPRLLFEFREVLLPLLLLPRWRSLRSDESVPGDVSFSSCIL